MKDIKAQMFWKAQMTRTDAGVIRTRATKPLALQGESLPFIVEPKEDISIMKLKDLIQEEDKKGMLGSVDAKMLHLWKVRMIMGQRHHN